MKTNNSKQRLFEIMGRLDKTFKPKLNESLYDQQGSPESKQIADILMRDPTKVMSVNLLKLKKPEIDQLLQQHPEFERNKWFMKYIENARSQTNSNLNETGEWSDDEDDIAWKKSLRNEIEQISDETHEKLKLIDVRGFDKYQGPYAIVDIDGKRYKVWTMEEQGQLWIEGYPVDNTSGEGTKAGFQGNAFDIIKMLGQKAVTSKDFSYSMNENPKFQEFQQKINNGDVWLEYYAPSDSEEYTDGQTFYNRSGQQLRDPEEYDPNGEGYTPFGDEG